MAVLAAILITEVYKRQGALHTEGVHHLDVVLCGHQDTDKMVNILHGSSSLSLRQLKQWWTNLPKANLSTLHPPLLDYWAWLCLALFFLVPLHSSRARLGLDLSPLLRSPGLCPALIPQCSPGLSCVCHLELCSSWGEGKSSGENRIKWCHFQGVLTFSSPQSYAPGMSGWYRTEIQPPPRSSRLRPILTPASKTWTGHISYLMWD